MIASLASQRDFLIQQAEEQRIRWASESDGWARITEALIAQRNKSNNPAVKDDVSFCYGMNICFLMF